MKIKYLILAVLCFAIAVNADAFVEDSSNYITFFEEQKTLSFTVENDSGQTQPLNISVFSPLSYEIKGTKNFLENGEKVLIEIIFTPKKELINSGYESTVLVELGKEITKKKVSMNFYKRNFCPVYFSAEQKGNLIELTAENTSFQEKEFEVLGLKNASSLKIENKSFFIEAGEEKKFSLNFTGNSDEKNFLLILCDGFEEETEIEFAGSDFDGIVEATGNVVFGLGGLIDPLNALLTLIAAVLLLLFVSRLVKRLNEVKE